MRTDEMMEKDGQVGSDGSLEKSLTRRKTEENDTKTEAAAPFLFSTELIYSLYANNAKPEKSYWIIAWQK